MTKRKKVYSWHIGCKFNEKDASIVGREFEKLEKVHGYIDKRIILAAATEQNSKLKKFFTWNNKKAAQKWREKEAQYLISNLTYEVIFEEEETHNYRAYVTTQKKRNPNPAPFQSLEKQLANKESRKELLDRAVEELQSFKDKYWFLKELATVFKEADKLASK
jgi:hypothetical protein